MKVLAIDGGGIRGLIPALVLAEIERRTGRPTAELFDLIAGTSTGGILACALCAPAPLPAEQLVALYEDEGPTIHALIFTGSSHASNTRSGGAFRRRASSTVVGGCARRTAAGGFFTTE